MKVTLSTSVIPLISSFYYNSPNNSTVFKGAGLVGGEGGLIF